jgi:hypothetical protein
MALGSLSACLDGGPTRESELSSEIEPGRATGGSESTNDPENLGGASAQTAPGELTPIPLPDCSAEAVAMMEQVNAYRNENGQEAIPFSKSLCYVAEAHVADLIAHAPYEEPGCSPNSWSEHGEAEGCCYDLNASNPACMWEKPKQLTKYEAYGYESVALFVESTAQAFDLWRASPGHSALMLNQAEWEGTPWLAVGAAYVDGVAALWLGEVVDSDPTHK